MSASSIPTMSMATGPTVLPAWANAPLTIPGSRIWKANSSIPAKIARMFTLQSKFRTDSSCLPLIKMRA